MTLRMWMGAILTVLVLVACTTGRKVSFAHGRNAGTEAPDSLKAKAHFIAIAADGTREKLSAVLFAVPRQRYRLELSGTMGISAASLLWQPTGWTLVFPTEEMYLQGQGAEIRVPGTLLSGIDVHQMAGLFWGELLPDGADGALRRLVGTDSVLEWEPRIGLRYRAVLRVDGWVKLLERFEEGREPIAVSYGAPLEMMAGRYVPASATFARGGKAFLEVVLKAADSEAEWAAGVWKLPVPDNYRVWSAGN